MALNRPEALWLILALLPFAALEARRLRRLFPGMSALWGRPAARAWLRRALLSRALAALALPAFALALADPPSGRRLPPGTQGRADIALALDLSGSMLVQDAGAGSRLEAALRSCRDLLSMRGERRFSLVAFKGEARLQVPLTDDLDSIELFLDAASPGFSSDKGSNPEGAIRAAAASLSTRTEAHRAIVLLSDGEALSGDARAAAAAARAEGIRVHAIGFGTEAGGLVPGIEYEGAPVQSRRNGVLLSALAKAGAGVYAPAEDGGALALLRSSLGMGKGRLNDSGFSALASLSASLGMAFLLLSLIAARIPRLPGSSLAALILALPLLGGCSRADLGLRLAAAADKANRGEHGAALVLYQALLDRSGPKDSQIIRFDMGLSLDALGRREEALESLREAAASEEQDLAAAAHYAIGWIEFSGGDYQAAWSSFRESLERKAGVLDARVGLELARERVEKEESAAPRAAADVSLEGGGSGQEEFDLIRNAEGRRFRAGRMEEESGDARDW